MFSTENKPIDFDRIKIALSLLSPKKQLLSENMTVCTPKRVFSMREALFMPSERILTKNSIGRICASPSVSCPPAIPPVISGELIDEQTVDILLHYGIEEIDVVKKD